MSQKVACITRDIKELDRWTAEAGTESLFFCTNSAVLSHCRSQNLQAVLLDEDIISTQFKTINTWAYKQTVDFVGRYPVGSKSYVFLQTHFMYVCAYFVQIVMNIEVLKRLCGEHGIQKIAMFKRSGSVLAATLESKYIQQHLGLKVDVRAAAPPPKKAVSLKDLIRKLLAQGAYQIFYAGREKQLTKATRPTMVSGALNHLAPVIELVRTRTHEPVVYVENEFNWEKFRFCRKNRLGFIWLKPSEERFMPDRKVDRYFRPGEIVYQGIELTDLYEDVFRQLFSEQALRFPYDHDQAADLLSRASWQAVILDEDWAMRRQFSVMADALGVAPYVISHGIPGILFDEDAKRYAGSYFSAYTFVSSEFEKEQYEHLCFKKERILNTGIPRYDEIVRIRSGGPHSAGGSKKSILYCGAGMHGFDFEFVKPSLGLKIGLAEATKTYTKDLVDICLRDSARLSLGIKPHYSQEAIWKEHVERCLQGRDLEHTLYSHRDNTFRLESSADVVVTVESSVICEAIMLEKPVIVLNYSGQDLTTPYDALGLVEHVRTKDELERAIQKCLFDEAYAKMLAQKRAQYFRYYAGAMDGKNAERVYRRIYGGGQ